MNEYLLVKLKENTVDSDDVPSVNMFYVHPLKHNASNYYQDEASLILEKFERNNMQSEYKSSPVRDQKDDVNEIIVKIEMKKFQNLIENRIKHKNNLLQADIKRVYPMSLQRKDSIEFDAGY